jgi:hypothetical protein
MRPKPRQFLSDQEFFEATWRWLIVENHDWCGTPLGAVYRDGALTCVVGAFIPEELYELNFPDVPITELLEMYPEFRTWFQHLTPELMLEVETVHNGCYSASAAREPKMRAVAEKFGLRLPSTRIV